MSDAAFRDLFRRAHEGDLEAAARWWQAHLRAGGRDPRRDPMRDDVVAGTGRVWYYLPLDDSAFPGQLKPGVPPVDESMSRGTRARTVIGLGLLKLVFYARGVLQPNQYGAYEGPHHGSMDGSHFEDGVATFDIRPKSWRAWAKNGKVLRIRIPHPGGDGRPHVLLTVAQESS